MRVLFSSCDSPGLLFPLIGLACELRARGHLVAFATGLPAVEWLNSAGLPRIPRGSNDGTSFNIARWAEPLAVALDVKHLEFAIAEFRPDIIVTHTLNQSALIVGERTGLKVGVLGLMSYLWPVPGGDGAEFSDGLAGTHKWRLTDMGRLYNQSRELFRLPRVEATPEANPFLGDLYMLRSVERLEPDAERFAPNVHLVGACLWEAPITGHDPLAAADWSEISESLGRGDMILYAHCGRTFGKPGFWPTVVEALADRPVRVIASVGRMDGDVGILPPNFIAKKHAPQEFIIPHARAVLSGGFSSPTLGALAAGRPNIVFPSGGETPDNAARVARVGCGISISSTELSVEAVCDALSFATDNTSLVENASSIATDFGRCPGFLQAAKLVEQLGPSRSHGETIASADATEHSRIGSRALAPI